VLERMSLGFSRILTAENGQDALEKAKLDPPDIIITDVVMPWLSGHELVESLKNITPHCVYIFISGHDDVTYLQKAISLKVFRYILKPIRIQELTEVLQLAIEESHKTKQQELYTFLESVPENMSLSEITLQQRMYVERNQAQAQAQGREYFELHKLRLKIAGFMMSLLDRQQIWVYGDVCDFTLLFACKDVTAVLNWYLTCLSKLETLSQKAASGSILNKAMQFIEDNYKHNIGSQEIASYCKISPGYLSSLFATKPHGSIPQYITDVRLKHALHMLQEDTSISEIAQNCGFSNANYFTKLFKRKYGKTPREIRGNKQWKNY